MLHLASFPAWTQNNFNTFIKPHKPTYALGAYSFTPNNSPLKGIEGELDHFEMKFQISFKVELFDELFRKYMGKKSNLYFGYTQLSLWQILNSNLSSPFRETNYEPELMLSFEELNNHFLGFTNSRIILGIAHQSNGRSEPLSRSWDRLYSDFTLTNKSKNLLLRLKPWFRFPESRDDDDNPDILKYMGYAELSIHYLHKRNQYCLMIRNNMRKPNRGAIQLEWSFPLSWIKLEGVNGFFQIFNGYGESLIDYDQSVTRIGFGINITNWI